MRKLLTSPFVMAVLARVYHAYMTLCFRTARVEWINRETLEGLDKPGVPLIVAFWHGRTAFMPFFASRHQHVHVIISRHKDGEFIARAMRHFGFSAVRGSSNRAATDEKGYKDRGGAAALREACTLLRRGAVMVVTPDGPRGPRFVVQQGVVALAQISGAPILPVVFSSTGAKVVKSWDRFILPWPFGKAVMIAGEPVSIPRKLDAADVETARKALEDTLNSITRRADERCGIHIG